jgi:hypothetical protein
LVTHLDVSTADCQRAVELFASVLAVVKAAGGARLASSS